MSNTAVFRTQLDLAGPIAHHAHERRYLVFRNYCWSYVKITSGQPPGIRSVVEHYITLYSYSFNSLTLCGDLIHTLLRLKGVNNRAVKSVNISNSDWFILPWFVLRSNNVWNLIDNLSDTCTARVMFEDNLWEMEFKRLVLELKIDLGKVDFVFNCLINKVSANIYI